MPIRYNDTPTPVEPPKVDSDYGIEPHGPGNRVQFDFAPIGPGDPKYLTGPPLAEINSVPYRGTVAAHGIDTDVRTDSYDDHPSPQDAEAGNDGQDWAQWVPPTPILVSVVDLPMETDEKYSRIIQAYSGTEFYAFSAVGVFDNSPVRTILPKDDTRVRATIFASPSPQFAAGSGNGAQYAYLVSMDQACQTGILLGTNVVNAPQKVEVFGKSPVFARIVPLATYDSTKVNNYTLQLIAETAVLGGKRVH